MLLTKKDDVNKFWPVAFAPGGHFERSLNSGFELGSVFVINCNKAEVGNARRVVGSGSNTIRRLRSNLYNSSRKATTTTKDIAITIGTYTISHVFEIIIVDFFRYRGKMFLFSF